jgi:hypothetical protein
MEGDREEAEAKEMKNDGHHLSGIRMAVLFISLVLGTNSGLRMSSSKIMANSNFHMMALHPLHNIACHPFSSHLSK